ncbi:MAG: hypothetical protein ABIT71_16405, partial [Vicinamibacteraceae bacterium]
MRRIHALTCFAAAVVIITGCASTAPPRIQFAPPGTDVAKLRSEFPLTDAERAALTPETIKHLDQAQVDQIYQRLDSGPIPDGPFRGDLFFPRGTKSDIRLGELSGVPRDTLAELAVVRVEALGKALWRGKMFFREEGALRNRIEELAVLKAIIRDAESIPTVTFEGKTTWLLFPAKLSCGASRFDAAHKSIVIDYSKGSTVKGYREVPDALAGPERLDIFDEVRLIRPGFYLGRAYFRGAFGLNFTLIDPATATSPAPRP